MNLSEITTRIDHLRNGGMLWLHYSMRLYRMDGERLQNHDVLFFERDFIGNAPKRPIHERFWGDSAWQFMYFMRYWRSEDILVPQQSTAPLERRQVRRVEL